MRETFFVRQLLKFFFLIHNKEKILCETFQNDVFLYVILILTTESCTRIYMYGIERKKKWKNDSRLEG